MKPHVSVITLGVRDFARARDFYVERLGWPVQQRVLWEVATGATKLPFAE